MVAASLLNCPEPDEAVRRNGGMGSQLPEFEDPPVVEVALSAQFEPLSSLGSPQMGLIWQHFRNRFPNTEEHAPLDPAVEEFGAARERPQTVHFEIMGRPPTPRCWFVNPEGTELIQVQRDRFIHNWRKVKGSEHYPRYEHIRNAFASELVDFEGLLAKERLGELVPNQCEVRYVNHILVGKGWDRLGQMGDVLSVCGAACSDDFLAEPEEGRFAASYVIHRTGDSPLGRLRVQCHPAYRKSDRKPMFVLTLTARGRPIGEGREGIMTFLDLGREWVVRGFASVTSPAMHIVWGRRDRRTKE